MNKFIRNGVKADFISLAQSFKSAVFFNIEYNQITSQTDLMSLGIGDEIEHEFYTITRDSRVQTSRSLLEI